MHIALQLFSVLYMNYDSLHFTTMFTGFYAVYMKKILSRSSYHSIMAWMTFSGFHLTEMSVHEVDISWITMNSQSDGGR